MYVRGKHVSANHKQGKFANILVHLVNCDIILNMHFSSQDVDTIYLSQDSRELSLQDFDHLNSK